MAADGKYTLLNGNLGLADHNYYQRNTLYEEVFREVWNRLIAMVIVSRPSGQRIPNQFYGAYVKGSDGNKLAFFHFG